MKRIPLAPKQISMTRPIKISKSVPIKSPVCPTNRDQIRLMALKQLDASHGAKKDIRKLITTCSVFCRSLHANLFSQKWHSTFLSFFLR